MSFRMAFLGLLLPATLLLHTGCGGSPSYHPSAWEAPAAVAGKSAAMPRILAAALDEADNGLALWTEVLPDGSCPLHADLRPAHGSWTKTKPIPTRAMVLAAGSNHNGTALLAWVDAASPTQLQTAFASASGGWGKRHTLDLTGRGTSREPALAVDERGNALLCWSGWDTATSLPTGLWAAYYDKASDAWHTPVNLGPQVMPTLRYSEPGNWMLCSIATNGALSSRVFTPATGSWSAPLRLVDPLNAGFTRANYSYDFQLDPSGNAVLAFNNTPHTDSVWHLYGLSYTKSKGSWSAYKALAAGRVDQDYPVVGLFRHGVAMVGWAERSKLTTAKAATFIAATGSIGKPVVLGDKGARSHAPRFQSNGDRSTWAVVPQVAADGTVASLAISLWNGQAWSPSEIMDPSPLGQDGAPVPTMTVSKTGQALMLWVKDHQLWAAQTL